MTKKPKTAISPTREEDYPKWYQEVIKAADLAEHSPVRGCMVIKPWGFGIWEKMQAILDKRFKETGHENAYFPLFIPLSYLEKEAKHVEGFAKECAVVTHHRLEKKGDSLVPAAPLEEPLIVRPTSEMIIGEMFAKWITSYRDLPLLINQWANVVRWEMRPRIFLRTAEFLWQEGHTAHATKEEALQETHQMLDIYEEFCREKLALPVIKGEKTEAERFPGAVATYTIEAMMQDGKALQCGTSHFLGQNFSKAANITFRSEKGEEEFAWTTSWGVTTRLLGALIMAHSDDNGLILPPRISVSHVAIVPFMPSPEAKEKVLPFCQRLREELQAIEYYDSRLGVVLDVREVTTGEKNWSWIKKGIPLRIEIGPKEVEEKKVTFLRRTRGPKEKEFSSREDFPEEILGILEEIQQELLKKALKFRDSHMKQIDSKEAFYEFFQNEEKGFALAHFAGDVQEEEKIQKELGVTIRCIPLDGKKEEGKCLFTGKKSPQRVIFARAY